MRLTVGLLLELVALATAQATTSIFLPGFDPQPVSLSEEGVGKDGRTTFLLAGPGEQTAESFRPTLTYVVGPSDVAWFGEIEGATASEGCKIGKNGQATCVMSAPATTTTQTLAISSFPVQVVGLNGSGLVSGSSDTSSDASMTAPSSVAPTHSFSAGSSASAPSCFLLFASVFVLVLVL